MMKSAAPSMAELVQTVVMAPRLALDMAPMKSMAAALKRQFRDPRLRQLFGRYSTYVGGHPGELERPAEGFHVARKVPNRSLLPVVQVGMIPEKPVGWLEDDDPMAARLSFFSLVAGFCRQLTAVAGMARVASNTSRIRGAARSPSHSLSRRTN